MRQRHAQQCGLADGVLPSNTPLESDVTGMITIEHAAALLVRGDQAGSHAKTLNWREVRTQLAARV